MAGVVTPVSSFLVDSGIGPIQVVSSQVSNYDIDDFMSTTVVSLAQFLKMLYLVQTVNPTLAQNRPVVNLNGYSVGGYK